MKKRLLNTLIIFFGVMASFAFYRFWQTESNPPLDNLENTKAAIFDTTNNHLVQKDTESTIALPRIPLDKNIPIVEPSKEPSKNIEPIDIPYDTPETMEAHTQEVYDALQPDNYEESIEAANEAFDVIDEKVRHRDEQLKEHMQISSPNQNDREENTIEEDVSYEMELPIING